MCAHFWAHAHPTFRFGKTVRHTPPTPWHITKTNGTTLDLWTDYVVGVTAILYIGYGVVINIVSKEVSHIHIIIGNIPHCKCPDFIKISSQALGKKMKWVYYKHLYYVLELLCKVDYESDKFIYAPTMRL